VDRPAIAVMPLVNMDGDLKRERIVDGLTEDLITTLSHADWYSTASRNCSFAYKGKEIDAQHITKSLGIRFLLQGSVRSIDGRHRVCIQLVDALTDRNVWAERYDCENINNIQNKISEEIASSIEPLIYQTEHLRAEGKSIEELSAWECTLRALSLMNTREKKLVRNALALMQRTRIMQPQSARVHSLLSFITTLCVHQGWQPRRREVPRAQHIARVALSLSSEGPWAYLASGYAKIWEHPEDAFRTCKRLCRSNQGLPLGITCSRSLMHMRVKARAPSSMERRHNASAQETCCLAGTLAPTTTCVPQLALPSGTMQRGWHLQGRQLQKAQTCPLNRTDFLGGCFI
jgi:TolB-like protein